MHEVVTSSKKFKIQHENSQCFMVWECLPVASDSTFCAHSIYVLCSCVYCICFTSMVSIFFLYLRLLYSSYSSFQMTSVHNDAIIQVILSFSLNVVCLGSHGVLLVHFVLTQPLKYDLLPFPSAFVLFRLVVILLIQKFQFIYITYLFQRYHCKKSHHTTTLNHTSLAWFSNEIAEWIYKSHTIPLCNQFTVIAFRISKSMLSSE